MTCIATSFGITGGATALDVLAAPASLAGSWVSSQPPWALLVLAFLALLLMWLPGRDEAPQPG